MKKKSEIELARIKMVTALKAAERDARARGVCDVEEILAAVMADERVQALAGDPVVQKAILADKAKSIARREYPDLLRAAKHGYDGAEEKLREGIRRSFKKIV
jgi:hypothetical protein